MRVGEIFGLLWDSVDLKNGAITVRRIWCQKVKGLKETTKTHKQRHFRMNQNLVTYLTALKLKSSSDFVIDREQVFCSCPSHAARLFRTDTKRSGVNEIRFHDLRHTYATRFVSNGGDIHALSKILGHSSSTMTDRYAHLADDVAKSAAELVSFTPPQESKLLQFGQKVVTKLESVS
jgi:integrase